MQKLSHEKCHSSFDIKYIGLYIQVDFRLATKLMTSVIYFSINFLHVAVYSLRVQKCRSQVLFYLIVSKTVNYLINISLFLL